MNITKKNQAHRHKEQTMMVASEEGEVEDKIGAGLRNRSYYIINKLQGCIVQHREYSQYFVVTISGI